MAERPPLAEVAEEKYQQYHPDVDTSAGPVHTTVNPAQAAPVTPRETSEETDEETSDETSDTSDTTEGW
jgi:hypothetical protein